MKHRWIACCARHRCPAWARGTRRGLMRGFVRRLPRARRSRTQWRAAAAMVVLAGGLYAAFAWSSRGEPAVGRVVAVPVYWSRDVRVERLDISRWTCQGCKN